ncbi:MAG: segregation/condensation protein A [Candidatus Omnitrophica bacterium]|nr:segregation/condensation protein A [Candidatus Omnitrophota bacterium]
MADYKVQLEVFEGPLDLLLYLIRKEEVSIYEVNLTRIATQFVEYVEIMRNLDLDIAGEFLVMAATLMFIKSRELLPVDQQAQVEDEEDQIDPRWDLIRQLVEYKKFKDVAAQLQNRESEQENRFRRQPQKPDLEPSATEARPEVSLLDLVNAVSAILRRFHQAAQVPGIFEDKWTVSEKIQMLLEMIAERPVLQFSELYHAAHSRSEIIATFLALLELIRLKRLSVSQSEPFGEIMIAPKAHPASVPPASTEAVPAPSSP